MGIPSFPGVSQVILPSQDIFCSSESLGINKSFKKDSITPWFLFLLVYKRGTWGEPEHRNTAKKINEHRITARKIDETPSPQQLFLAI